MAFSAVYGQQELSVEDSRSTPTTPLQYNFKLKPSFKFNTVLGLNAPGFYSTVLGIRGWGDDSGGKAHELAFTDADLYIRSGYDAGWEAWRKIIVADGKGYVGIGTNNPQTQLEVQGTAIIYNKNGDNYNENLRLPSSQYGYSCIALGAIAGTTGTGFGQWSLVKFPEKLASKFSIRHFDKDHLSILTNGYVGVGTTTPQEKLSVNGNIRAKEIKVEATNWPDYVFEEDYPLTPLPEIEAFIKINKHLPDIPSAQKIAEEGLSVGEMNKLMMKKIEELTLYLIEKDKEVHKLNEKMTEMEKEIIALKKINN